MIFAGVTQLVESQFSKLKVDGSSPFSRSTFPGAARTKFDTVRVTSTNTAHLAQLVEHVLGKDEVTSSILVVGSKRLRPAAAVGQRRGAPYAVAAVGGGDGVTTESATN